MRSELHLVRPETPVRPEEINQERLDRLADLIELDTRIRQLEEQATEIRQRFAIQTGYLARQQVAEQMTDVNGKITIPAAVCQPQGLVFDGLRGVLHPPFTSESVQEAWVLVDAEDQRVLSPDVVVTASLGGEHPELPLLAKPFYAQVPLLSSPLDPVQLTWTVQAGAAWQGFQVNLIDVDVFPVCAVDLASISIWDGTRFVTAPGWQNGIPKAGFVRLSLPPQPVSGLKLVLQQNAAVPVEGEDQYVLGFSRVRAGRVTIPDELAGAAVEIPLPNGTKEISRVEPVFLFADALPGQGVPGFSYLLTDPAGIVLPGLPAMTDATQLSLTFQLSPAAFAGALPQLAAIIVTYRLL